MLNISLRKLNDFIQPLGHTVAIVRDDKNDKNGPYHAIWIGENDEFIYKKAEAETNERPQTQMVQVPAHAYEEVLNVLENGLRSGAHRDEPEGTRNLTVSDTLARSLAQALRGETRCADEFLRNPDEPDAKKPQALDDAIEVLRHYLGSDAQIIIDVIQATCERRKEK